MVCRAVTLLMISSYGGRPSWGCRLTRHYEFKFYLFFTFISHITKIYVDPQVLWNAYLTLFFLLFLTRCSCVILNKTWDKYFRNNALKETDSNCRYHDSPRTIIRPNWDEIYFLDKKFDLSLKKENVIERFSLRN